MKATELACEQALSGRGDGLEDESNYLVNDKITAWCQTNIPLKHYFKRYKRQKLTLKNNWANKFSKTTIAIRFKCNLPQVCPSKPPFDCICCVTIASINVLSDYFYVSLNLVAVPIA